jgi:L-lactate dehydrogenase complex protein LldG
MSAARDEILRRVSAALQDVPAAERPDDVPVTRDYDHGGGRPADEVMARLSARLGDYGAEVRQVPLPEVGGAVADACSAMGLARVVVPAGLERGWRPGEGVEVVEDHGLSPQELDRLDGAVTGCAVAIAETGTLILDGQDSCGRRVITLVPDHHVCVVTEDQVVGSVPEAVTRLGQSVRDHRVPVTLISGPSATADIELSRVQGVHGPRHLFVIIAS